MSPLASVAQASMKGPQLIVLTLYDPEVILFLSVGWMFFDLWVNAVCDRWVSVFFGPLIECCFDGWADGF